MSWFARRRTRYPSLDEVETVLRAYFAASAPDVSGTDLRSMAETAMRSQLHPTDSTSSKKRISKRSPLLWAGYAIAACAFVLALARVTFYLAPNWEQAAYAAIGSLPASRFVIDPTDAGMLELAERGQVQAMDVSARDQGISVQVLGAYADSIRTVLFLRVRGPQAGAGDAGSWMPMPGLLVLTDQFGHRYSLKSGQWQIGADAGNLQFEGISPWKLALGLRLRLQVPAMQWVPARGTDTGLHDIKGSWTLDWVQTSVGSERTVQVDSVATSNGVRIMLTTVRLSPSATEFALTATMDAASAPGSSIGDGALPGKPLAKDELLYLYVERVADGKRFPWLSYGTTGYGRFVTGKIVTVPLTQPGKYVLVIQGFNGRDGHWELPFAIP